MKWTFYLLELRPLPSAMFEVTEDEERLIWSPRAYISVLGNLL